jgi:hypothetical protein
MAFVVPKGAIQTAAAVALFGHMAGCGSPVTKWPSCTPAELKKLMNSLDIKGFEIDIENENAAALRVPGMDAQGQLHLSRYLRSTPCAGLEIHTLDVIPQAQEGGKE